MVSCGNIMQMVLVTIVLVALSESSHTGEKLASCCQKVTNLEIKEQMLGYLVQSKPVLPCIKAVIVQTENGLFCVNPRAPWLAPTIRAFQKAKHPTSASPSPSPSQVSLLSIITSTV